MSAEPFSDEWRAAVSAAAAGKTVARLEWVAEERYWVMTFTDGSEVSLRLMVEIVAEAGV
jgi:hypothetical protein